MLPVEALDMCWKEGQVLRKHRGRDGKGKTCREQGNQSSLGKRRRISRDEERHGWMGMGLWGWRKAESSWQGTKNLLRFKMGSFTWWLHQGTVEIPICPPVLHHFCTGNGSRLEEGRRGWHHGVAGYHFLGLWNQPIQDTRSRENTRHETISMWEVHGAGQCEEPWQESFLSNTHPHPALFAYHKETFAARSCWQRLVGNLLSSFSPRVPMGMRWAQHDKPKD